MSSSYVRTQFLSFLTTNFLTENVIDMTAEYEEMKEFLDDNNLTYLDAWLGIDFLPTDEIPIAVTTNTSQGCYRETGSLFFHVTEPAAKAAATNIVSRAEVLRSGLRGHRIGDIIVESVTPVSTQGGTTLQFEAGFTSGSFILNYYRDLNI